MQSSEKSNKPPRLQFQPSRLFQYHAFIEKTISVSNCEVISTNSDTTINAPAIDGRERLQQSSINSLSSGETTSPGSEPENWEDLQKCDYKLYPTSKETVKMIQESLGLLSRKKTCLKTGTSLVESLFEFVASNTANVTKSVTFADPLVTASHSLSDYAKLLMARKIHQLELVEEESNFEEDIGIAENSVDSVDSLILEELSSGSDNYTIASDQKNLSSTSIKIATGSSYNQPLITTPSDTDLSNWCNRAFPDSDIFSLSSTQSSSSFGSEDTEDQVSRLRRTKKFIKDNYIGKADLQTNPSCTATNIRPTAFTDRDSFSNRPLKHQEYYEVYQSGRSESLLRAPICETAQHLKLSKEFGYTDPNTKMKIQNRYYEIPQCPAKVQQISLRQSIELDSKRILSKSLDGRSSPESIRKYMKSPKPSFGIKVKEIFSRWF